MKVSIIGAGNTGKAMTVYLKSKNIDIRLYDRNSEKVSLIKDKGIISDGQIKGTYFIDITNDLDYAISDSELILIMTDSPGHLPIAKILKNKLSKNQSIIIFNGNWGAYEFYKVLNEDIKKFNITLSETSGMVFTVAFISQNEIKIKKIKESVEIGFLTDYNKNQTLNFMKENFKGVSIANNIIETSLNNSNPTIHVSVIAMNLARIQSGDSFLFYVEGASKNSLEYAQKIDQERLEVCEKLGVKGISVLDILNSFWPDKKDNLYDLIHTNESYKTAKGPKSFNHRYFFEDIPFGIYPIKNLAEQLNVKTPYINALLDFLSLSTGVDYQSMAVKIDLETIKEYILV